MPHLVRKRWNQLKEGDQIKLKGDPRIWDLEMKTGGANFTVEYTPHGEWDNREVKEVVFSEDYEGNWVFSEDCEAGVKAFRQVEPDDVSDDGIYRHAWSECEKHYGIGHLGSAETDPLKQLALAILRGDPQACDAARDILRA